MFQILMILDYRMTSQFLVLRLPLTDRFQNITLLTKRLMTSKMLLVLMLVHLQMGLEIHLENTIKAL